MARAKAKTKQPVSDAYDPSSENIVDLPAVEQLDKDYGAFARAVITDRAVPDVRSGMKPVHQRILWGMHLLRLTPDKPHVKTARVTGEVMGKFHPHGDASISDAIARLAQPFSNLLPLLDFRGSYGSPDFGPASPRYTETRLGKFGMLMLDEIDQGVVQMVENYEGSTVEPLVLPTAFPNLLINGANGIAVGLSSYLPPHDPREVIAAASFLLANPKATVDDLMAFIPGPSFPEECTITNGDELAQMYRTGVGRVVVKGAWTVEDIGKGRQQIVITALPYADTKIGANEKFITNLADACDSGEIIGVTGFNDESSGGKTRVTIALAAGIVPEQIAAALLRLTNLMVTNKCQMHFLDEHGVVKLYNLRSALQAWVDHRIAVVTRRSEQRLEKISERLHRLSGFVVILADIDKAIQIVRSSKSRALARAELSAFFKVDDAQASAFLDLNLGQLTEDTVVEFVKEAERLEKEQSRLQKLLASPTLLRRQVANELEAITPLFDDVSPRVTTITTEDTSRVSKQATIVAAPITVHVDAAGYLQSIRAASKAKSKVDPVLTFETTTATNLVAITPSGVLHRALANSVPADKATAAVNVFPGLDSPTGVLQWWTDDTLPEELLLVTSDGQVKKMATSDLVGGDRKGGISIIKLAPSAVLVAVLPLTEGVTVLLATASGVGIRFSPADLRPMGRSASGVTGIKLALADVVVSAAVVTEGSDVVVLADTISGKRFSVADMPTQGRAGKGVRLFPPDKAKLTFVSTSDILEFLAVTKDNEHVAVPRASFPLGSRESKLGRLKGGVTFSRLIT